jgi:SET domain-containing protein
MGRVINHSKLYCNCEFVLIWNAGVPQALVIAIKDIAKGDQIFADYEQLWKYFEERKEDREKGDKKKSIQNFDENEMFQIRGEKEFFALNQAIEMGDPENPFQRINF